MIQINPPRTPIADGNGYISPEWYRFLVQVNRLGDGAYLTLGASPVLGSGRVFTPSADLDGVDGGAGGAYTLGLADTAVVPGTYGNPAGFVTITVDQKGRLTGATTFALSGASGVDYNTTTGVISAHPAGAYGAPTGTLSRTALASYTAGTGLTFGAAYSQAEHTALAARLASVEAALAASTQTLAALITDLKANGNLA